MAMIQEIRHERSSVCIILDTGEHYWIRKSDFSESDFYEQAEYNHEDFMLKIRVLQYPRALNHAVAMLAKRPCSKSEIRTRLLQKQYSEDVTDLVVYKLEKENLLNDQEFCDQWIRSRVSRKYGPARIRMELKMKGIEEDYITEGLNNLDTDEELQNACILANKYRSHMKPDDDIRKNRQKIVSALVRKGYSWETARMACDKTEQQDMI